MPKMKCRDCFACKRLYDYALYQYSARKEYYCIEKEEMVNLEDSCEKWKKRKLEYDLSLQRIDEVENDVKRMMQMFKK